MLIEEEYFEDKEFREKLRSYEAAMETGGAICLDDDDLTDIIDYYNYRKEYQKAADVAEYALGLYPGSAGPLVFKIRRALDAGDASTAYALAEMIEDKSQVEYYYIRAEIELAQNCLRDAERILLKRFMEEEDDEEDRNDYCLDCADLYIDYGAYDLASRWLERCSDEENADYLELRGRCAYGVNDYSTAEMLLGKLIDMNPYKYRYWNILSEMQADEGKISEAVTSSGYSLAICPDNLGGLVGLTRGMLELGNTPKAIEFIYRAADIYKDLPDMYVKFMSLLLHFGKVKEAYDFFKYAPTNGSRPANIYAGYSYMAIACNELGLKEEFEENLRIAIDHNIDEVKMVMGKFIPRYVPENDYYEYIVNLANSKRNESEPNNVAPWSY